MLASGTVNGDLVFLSAAQQAALVRDKQLSPVELVSAYLDRIDRLDGRLRAYITVCRETALAAARRAEDAVSRGASLGVLHGIPFAVKDQFATRGRADHRRLAHPRRQRPRRGRHRGGAAHRGRRHPARQAEPDRVRAGRHDPLSLRPAAQSLEHRPRHRRLVGRLRDRGGGRRSARSRSARTPAARCDPRPSWCGVAGHRPTWGLVSRHGCIPLSWSLDAPGPLGRTVEDCALAAHAHRRVGRPRSAHHAPAGAGLPRRAEPATCAACASASSAS